MIGVSAWVWMCVLWSLDVTAAKHVDYVFQGAGSEEALVSEDCSLWPLWPRLLPMGGAQKTQILNLLSFSPQACWCILQRSLQGSRGWNALISLINMVSFNTWLPSSLHFFPSVLLPFPAGCSVTLGHRRHASETWCFKNWMGSMNSCAIVLRVFLMSWGSPASCCDRPWIAAISCSPFAIPHSVSSVLYLVSWR